MKKLFAIAAITLLTSTTVWAEDGKHAGIEGAPERSQGPHMMGIVNCGHTHPKDGPYDLTELDDYVDG